VSQTVCGGEPHRRRNDPSGLSARLSHFTARLTQAWDPVAGGRLLLVTNGAVIAVTTPLVDEDRWSSLALLSASVTVLAWLAALAVPWSRLPRRCTLAFPLLAWAAMGGLGLATHGVAANWGVLFTLWFAYLGLTHRSGSSLLMLVPGLACYIALWDGWSAQLVTRMILVAVVWVLLAELLCALVARSTALTEEMRQLAHLDPLTNLANRRDLDQRLTAAHPGDTVVLLDLDHFKALNDSQGHTAGDSVLADFGLVVRATLRQADYAARYGGEEFALLLPETNEAETAVTLQRLRQRWSVLRPDVTFSAGLACWRTEWDSTEALIAADRALYRAKSSGRNCDYSAAGRINGSAAPQPV